MMSTGLDIILVAVAVAGALGYLIQRKLRSSKTNRRDWASGHSECCANCAIIEIRRVQLAAKKD